MYHFILPLNILRSLLLYLHRTNLRKVRSGFLGNNCICYLVAHSSSSSKFLVGLGLRLVLSLDSFDRLRYKPFITKVAYRLHPLLLVASNDLWRGIVGAEYLTDMS